MADPYLKNGKWYLRIKDARGVWRDRATGARTKAEARRLSSDLERRCERQRLGLEPLPSDEPELTFGAAMDLWHRDVGQHLRSQTIWAFMQKHLRPELGELPLSDAADALGRVIRSRKGQLAPETLNHLRGAAHRVYAYLKREKLWTRDNPASDVPKERVPKRIVVTLSADEAGALLRVLPARWLPLFLTAIFLGLRKGELLALRWSDLDLRERTVRVARSNEEDTTKGGHEDVLPIPEVLVPFLEAARDAARSDVVFARPDGRQHAATVALHLVLRRALGRAGIVTGYVHTCRRKGCGFEMQAAGKDAGRCPECGMKLWVKPIPRKLRFHDLRHYPARGISATPSRPCCAGPGWTSGRCSGTWGTPPQRRPPPSTTTPSWTSSCRSSTGRSRSCRRRPMQFPCSRIGRAPKAKPPSSRLSP